MRKLAERSGFEPEKGFYPLTHLAGGRFRPLSHLSALGLEYSMAGYRCPNVRPAELWRRLYIGLVSFSCAGTLISRATGARTESLAPYLSSAILVAGGLALALCLTESVGRRRALFASAGLLILGAGVEIVGVATGVPFGRYEYTSRWAPVLSLPGTVFLPAFVPLAWFVMAGGSAIACTRLGRASVPAAGMLAAAVDLLMEPSMTGKLAYWRWIEPGPLPGGAPWSNVLGWFASSAMGAAIVAVTLRGNRVRVSTGWWIVGGQLALSLALWAS